MQEAGELRDAQADFPLPTVCPDIFHLGFHSEDRQAAALVPERAVPSHLLPVSQIMSVSKAVLHAVVTEGLLGRSPEAGQGKGCYDRSALTAMTCSSCDSCRYTLMTPLWLHTVSIIATRIYVVSCSYGASSWFLKRKNGNIMFDSPRFHPGLAKRIKVCILPYSLLPGNLRIDSVPQCKPC